MIYPYSRYGQFLFWRMKLFSVLIMQGLKTWQKHVVGRGCLRWVSCVISLIHLHVQMLINMYFGMPSIPPTRLMPLLPTIYSVIIYFSFNNYWIIDYCLFVHIICCISIYQKWVLIVFECNFLNFIGITICLSL